MRLTRAVRAAGRAQAAHHRRRTAAARRPCRSDRRPDHASPASRTSRSPPTACCSAKHADGTARRPACARHRQPRQPRPGRVRAHERRLRQRRRSAGRHRARAARRPRADQGQRGRPARRQRPHGVLALVEHFRGTRRHRALHRVHGRRQPQRLAARAGACRRSELLALIQRALAAARRCARTIAARSPSATRSTTARAKSGFISSVTQPFCGDCSRARLSSDGVLYTCLFAQQGTDLRAPLRAGAGDDELLAHDPRRLERARDRYSELRAEAAPQRRRVRKSK